MPSGRVPKLLFEYVILALLYDKQKHGYELYKELEAWEGLSEVWKLKQGMLYANLNKLEKLQYLASLPPDYNFSPPRVELKITEAGRQALQDWLTSSVSKPRDIRPEFLAKLLVSARFGKASTLRLLDLQESQLKRWQDEEKAKSLQGQSPDPYLRMVHSFRSHWVNQIAIWLQDCRKALTEQ